VENVTGSISIGTKFEKRIAKIELRMIRKS
jgi:hypothetical protein